LWGWGSDGARTELKGKKIGKHNGEDCYIKRQRRGPNCDQKAQKTQGRGERRGFGENQNDKRNQNHWEGNKEDGKQPAKIAKPAAESTH